MITHIELLQQEDSSYRVEVEDEEGTKDGVGNIITFEAALQEMNRLISTRLGEEHNFDPEMFKRLSRAQSA